jgi:hypothetical protein
MHRESFLTRIAMVCRVTAMDGRQEGEAAASPSLSRADQFHGTGLSSSSGGVSLVAILRAHQG